MKLVENTFSQRYEVKKSIFISYLTPIAEFEKLKNQRIIKKAM